MSYCIINVYLSVGVRLECLASVMVEKGRGIGASDYYMPHIYTYVQLLRFPRRLFVSKGQGNFMKCTMRGNNTHGNQAYCLCEL